MSSRTLRVALTPLAACLLLGGLTTLAGAQQPKKPADRIEKKTYNFKEAGKEMEYALFVPSTYDRAKKTPLVVALHGLGGNPQQMIRSRGLTDQAEKYGYIVVAPMGYNSSGWYGARGPGRGFGGKGKGKGNCLAPAGSGVLGGRSCRAARRLQWRHERARLPWMPGPAAAPGRTGAAGRGTHPLARRSAPRRQAASGSLPQGRTQAPSQAARA